MCDNPTNIIDLALAIKDEFHTAYSVIPGRHEVQPPRLTIQAIALFTHVVVHYTKLDLYTLLYPYIHLFLQIAHISELKILIFYVDFVTHIWHVC